jgi:hypothetical protein
MSHTYYDFFLACDLFPDVSAQVLATLRYMTRAEDYEFHDPPEHPLFQYRDTDDTDDVTDDTDDTDGPHPETHEPWRNMLRMVERHATPGVSRCVLGTRRNLADTHDTPTLSLHYEGTEDDLALFSLFAEWIAPYSSTLGWVGYFRSRYDLYPTLLYFREGLVYLSNDEQKPVDLQHDMPW